MNERTIFAVSTGRGRAAIAVVRLSGPRAGTVAERLAGGGLIPRRAGLRILRRPADGAVLDHALVLWFPGPDSATGEDLAEFHVHGGPAVIAGVLETLAAERDLRPAEAGEFTRRAFENGRLDLTAVEGLADLLAAETEAQRRQALRQFEGQLGALYDGWRGRLLRALAHFEANIDFSDEDLPPDLEHTVRADVSALTAEIAAHEDDGRRGERLRDGVVVAVLGAPNAGKSSLINTLARRDVAIVSEQPGTTRDVIEVHLDLGGYPVTVLDTAGLRAGADAVESEGVRRALDRAASADVRLVLFGSEGWRDWDAASLALVDGDAMPVITKADLIDSKHPARSEQVAVAGIAAILISIKDGTGLEALLQRLGAAVAAQSALSEGPALTRARHRMLIGQCRAALRRFLDLGPNAPTELAAEDLRAAAAALGRLTGRIDVEDLLDVVFRDFCIGK